MHPLRPGDPEKLGAYVISGRLTDGPRGAAFLGRESDDAPLRVIKLWPSEAEPGSDELARLTAVQRVSSAYVARTLEAGKHDDHLYVVREHVEGRSLAETVAEDGPLDADALERVAVGVLTALTAVHLAGITHRGLTPANVILGPDGPRVTDIDLGEPVGEMGYRAPEQIRGLAYGPYADVFAWAAIVVFAATGQPPFGQDADAVLNGRPELGSLTDPLRRVVASALAKDVSQRPTTYMALLQLLGDKRAGIAPQKGGPEGVPLQGVPVQGVPGQGVPGQGAPIDGVPVQGPPIDGVPVPPPAGPGAAVPPQQAWGPPPVPPQAGAPGGPDGPVPPQQALPAAGGEPVQGVPVPPPGPAWEPPREQTRQAPVAGQTVSDRPQRKFPAGMVAAVGVLALLSGVGLWGANQYASTQKFEPVAAAGDKRESNGSGSERTDNVVTQGQADQPGQGQPQQGQPEQNQPEVTVPWATPSNGDSDDVGPMVLPNDWSSQPPATPILTTVPTPAPIATQQVVVPTVTVTQGDDPNSRERRARPTRSQNAVDPSATPSETPTPVPTVTVTATPTPTVTVTPSETPTPVPTVTVTATPTPTVTITEVPPSEVPTTTAPPPTATAKPTNTAKPTSTATKPPATNPYTAPQVCGSGFSVQRSQAFKGGETFQLYNASTGENCVVTLKRVDIGKATEVSATLEVQGQAAKTERGMYQYYAGPVKMQGKGKCVRFAGSVGDESTRTGWANCG